MRHPKTKEMLTYWKNRFEFANQDRNSNARPLWPDRCDIQPAECSSLLSSMFILQVDHGRSNYRLAGTELCALHGRELKREAFEKPFAPEDQSAAANWVAHLDHEQIVVLLCSRGENKWGDAVSMETLLLPLAHNGIQNERVLGLTVAHKAPNWIKAHPVVQQTIQSVRVMKPWEEHLQQHQDTLTITPPPLDNADIIPLPGVPERIFPNTPEQNPLLHGEDPHLSVEEITGAYEPARMVGHLKIIDGGRQS
ncbi:MAG: PAS domain-containing protein [Pseudomonadota bacterium]